MAGRYSSGIEVEPEHICKKITFYVKHRFPAGPQKDWPEIKFKFYIYIFVTILCSILSGNSHIMDKSF